MALTWILLGLVVFIVGYIFVAYNRLVSRRQHVKEAWSDIDVQLKRRHNLIPNLVETVKGYAQHERSTFDSVTNARAQALGANTPAGQAQAENALSSTLKTLFAVAENYPALRANENFLELQRELADTENKIQAARRFYNGNVRDYNTALETVPSNVIASLFKFTPAEYFEITDDSQRALPTVKF